MGEGEQCRNLGKESIKLKCFVAIGDDGWNSGSHVATLRDDAANMP